MDDLICKTCNHTPTEHRQDRMFYKKTGMLVHFECTVIGCRCEKFVPTWLESEMRR